MQAENVLLEPYLPSPGALPRVRRPRDDQNRQNFMLRRSIETAAERGKRRTRRLCAGAHCLQRLLCRRRGLHPHDRGRLSCRFVRGMKPCQNQGLRSMASHGYDAERDTDNPRHSVFCDHGGSITVPWNEVPAHVHCRQRDIRTWRKEASRAARAARRGVGAGARICRDRRNCRTFSSAHTAQRQVEAPPRSGQQKTRAPRSPPLRRHDPLQGTNNCSSTATTSHLRVGRAPSARRAGC